MRRLLAALALAVTALLTVTASPANAIDLNPFNDCKVQGTINGPDAGVAASIDGGPQHPNHGDPFAKNTNTTIYDQYGYSAYQWHDMKCSVTDFNLSAWGGIANFGMTFLGVVVAAAVSITRFAFSPDALDLFNPIMRVGAEALGDGVFKALFWVTIVATAGLIAWKAGRARLRESAGGAGWLALAGLIGIVCMTWPLTLAPVMDTALTHTIGAVNTQVAHADGQPEDTAADGIGANISRDILYRAWCAGEVGSATNATADEFCPKLFKASNISRSEEAKVQKASDPAQAQADLIKQKQDNYNKLANELKKKDPVAWEYLAGHQNFDRVATVALAWLALACASLFLITAALSLLVALIVIRLAILVAPALAVVAGYPPLRHMLLGVFDKVAAAIITALVFGSLAAVFASMIGVFLGSGLNPVLSAVLMAVTTGVAWHFTKPWRHMKTFLKPRFNVERDERWWNERKAGEQGNDGSQTARTGGQIFTPRETQGYSQGTPAEAQPSFFAGAAKGAATGALSTAALGVATGGTVTLGAMAAGAARGAAVGGAGAKFGTVGAMAATAATMPRGALGGAPTSSEAPQQVSAAEAGDFTPPAVAATPAPQHALPAAPVTDENGGPRVYTPGESNPAENARLVEPAATSEGEKVYPIYTPDSKEASL